MNLPGLLQHGGGMKEADTIRFCLRQVALAGDGSFTFMTVKVL